MSHIEKREDALARAEQGDRIEKQNQPLIFLMEVAAPILEKILVGRGQTTTVTCVTCDVHVPTWFATGAGDRSACKHCLDGLPYPRFGETEQIYVERCDVEVEHEEPTEDFERIVRLSSKLDVSKLKFVDVHDLIRLSLDAGLDGRDTDIGAFQAAAAWAVAGIREIRRVQAEMLTEREER